MRAFRAIPALIRPALIAAQFLTRVPIPMRSAPDAVGIGRSLSYYPLIGLLIGLVLLASFLMMSEMEAVLRAAILVTLWAWITGGLHLDGLADSADAWAGGTDKRSSVRIMKDPHIGVIGTLWVMLVLLLKFAALTQLTASSDTIVLLIAPMLGRAAACALLMTTPYVSNRGIGTDLARFHRPVTAALAVIVSLILTVFLTGTWGLISLLSVSALFLGLRYLMCKRLGGATGDTTGALIELTETCALVSLVALA